MGQVLADISMSLDGFIAGPNDNPELGLGVGGERLHEWLVQQESRRERHGLEGGESGADSDEIDDLLGNAGAVIVGKRMYDFADGWGDEPPFRMPVFVLTHQVREPLAKQGGTTYFS